MSGQTRPYHVVVWGTTGVVGRLVAEQLTRDYQKQGVKWAIAGRNQQKLESIREDLAKIDPTVKEVPIITADVSDKSSMESLAKSTKVVLATAGPFAAFGTPMVEACLATSTNYCDITGESNFARKIARLHDEEAKQKGIRIIPMCGFDSVPSDIGTFLVAEHLRTKHNKKVARVENQWTDTDGRMSGGTVASLFGAVFDEHGEDRAAFSDPYGLDPPGSQRGPDGPDSFSAAYSELHKAWHMPFFMAPINTRVVRRSNALLDHAYGPNFSYTESMRMPGRVAAYLGTAVYLLVAAISRVQALRGFLTARLPPPGWMPPREKTEGGKWTALVKGLSEEPAGGKPVEVLVKIKSKGDPGYWSTARLLIECGLSIALEEEELKKSGGLQAGVLTPATALGNVLANRLKNNSNGIFEISVTEST